MPESDYLISGRIFWLKEMSKVLTFIKCLCARHCSRDWKCRDEQGIRQTWPLTSWNILVGVKRDGQASERMNMPCSFQD